MTNSEAERAHTREILSIRAQQLAESVPEDILYVAAMLVAALSALDLQPNTRTVEALRFTAKAIEDTLNDLDAVKS